MDLRYFPPARELNKHSKYFLMSHFDLWQGGPLEPCMLTPWQRLMLFGVRKELVHSPLVSHAESLDHMVANVHPKTLSSIDWSLLPTKIDFSFRQHPRLLDRLLQVSRLCRYSRQTVLELDSRWRLLLKWFFTVGSCWPYILNCCISDAKGNSYERAGTLGFRCAADVHGGAPGPYHYRQFDIEFV